MSLFAGVGGFDLAFDRAGFEIVAHVEKDANCRKLLAEKWPGAVALDDVCTAGAHNLPPCDVVTFGFPCQDLSVAGNRAGLSGERSGLFYEATRIIRELRPGWALFENVPGLFSSNGGRDFAYVLHEMGECGYHGAWAVLDAQWHGVAQRRRRVFGLFTRLDSGAERCAEILSIPTRLQGHPPPSREAGEGAPYSVAPCLAASGRGTERAGETRGQDCVIPTVAGTMGARAKAGGGFSTDFECAGGLIPTVAGCLQERDAKGADSDTKPGHLLPVAQVQWASGGGQVLNPTAQALRAGAEHNYQFAQVGMQVRRLTPTECERLQGFPDGWTAGFSDSVRYKCLGNAVCVNVAEWIAKRLKEKACNGGET